jgi:valyl-tRNA synthetase
VLRWRNDAGVPAGAILNAKLDASGYDETLEHLSRLARLNLTPSNGNGTGESAVASVPVAGGVIELLASDALDPEAFARRREQQLAKLQAEITRAEKKLANPGFTDQAPAEVVQAERDKLARLKAEAEAL